MFNTLLSYLSRFSRLILLTFVIIVVLLLLIFTINSATDDNGVVQTTDSEASTSIAASDEVSYDGDNSQTQLVIVNEGASLSTDNEGNPQVFGSNDINLDSSDSVTVITVDNNSDEATQGGATITSTGLPNTGTGETLIASAAILALLTFASHSYITSRQKLQVELLENNR